MKQTPVAMKPVDKYMVPVVQSTFRILEELSRTGALGLNEVTQRTGISKSTVFRILTTLTQLGYVVRDGGRRYYVSQCMGDLVSAEAGIEAIRRASLPQMLKLRDDYGETVNLGQLEFDKVTYVEVVPSEYALRLHERPGATVCLHASALGKAILAFADEEFVTTLIRNRELPMLTRNTITDHQDFMAELRRVRERGYALDRGETTLLATCVAAPILNGSGNAIAAVSISGPSSRFNPRKNGAVIESLIQATSAISRQLRMYSEPGSRAGARRIGRQR